MGKNQLFNFACLSLGILLLSSCSTTHNKHHDGPPKYYVDESRIRNAVPKPEPLAKYGNMRSYVVFGKRYYTLRSSHNYEATGTASWYGTQFHAHKTSSGEQYNMLAMTAAHKTLPLPTYVEVTNLKNHRQIIVKVNDRGPFVSNRVIDLSYVAAKKLGMLGHGTAYVHIRAIDPYQFGRRIDIAKNTRSLHTGPAHLSHNQYVYLQVGAFKSRMNAEKLRLRLVSLVNTPITIFTPSGRSSLYRVQIGPIHNLALADKIRLDLLGVGIQSNKLSS